MWSSRPAVGLLTARSACPARVRSATFERIRGVDELRLHVEPLAADALPGAHRLRDLRRRDARRDRRSRTAVHVRAARGLEIRELVRVGVGDRGRDQALVQVVEPDRRCARSGTATGGSRLWPFQSSSASKWWKRLPLAGSIRKLSSSAGVMDDCGGIERRVDVHRHEVRVDVVDLHERVGGRRRARSSRASRSARRSGCSCRTDGKSWPGGAAPPQSVEPPEGRVGSIGQRDRRCSGRSPRS